MRFEPQGPGQRIEQAPRKITAAELSNIETSVLVDGFRYLPDAPYDYLPVLENIGRRFEEEPWFQALIKAGKDLVSDDENPLAGFRSAWRQAYASMSEEEIESRKEDGTFYGEWGAQLLDFYFHYKKTHADTEPEWFSLLGSEERKLFSHTHYWGEATREAPQFRFGHLGYTGINSFVIENVELFDDLEGTFDLLRLNSVKQFGYKMDSVPEQSDQRQRIYEFYHTRFRHLFSAAGIANLLAKNSALSPKDALLFKIVAVTHDYRTPAGGDTTKMADPEAFDEDKHYNEIFETDKWKSFAVKYNISKEDEDRMYRTVLGEGVLGAMLDVVDKVTYVAADIDLMLHAPYHGPYHHPQARYDEKGNEFFQQIKSAADADPLFASIWDSVEINGENVVFTDWGKLANFLKLRAVMFKNFYMSPFTRAYYEIFVSRLVKNMLDNNNVTTEFLNNAMDGALDAQLKQHFGVYYLAHPFPDTDPEGGEIRLFDNPTLAHAFAKTFNDDPDKIAIVDNIEKAPSSATQKFLVKKDGEIMTFKEAFPEQAKEIDDVMASIKQLNVYVISLRALNSSEMYYPKIKEIFKIK